MKSIKFIYILIILFLGCNCSVYAQEWVKIYRNNASGYKNSEEKASAMAIDSEGNICVVGNSSGYQINSDICLIKYNTNGDTLWTRVYNGNNNSEDKAYAITVDDLDNIYIGGYTGTENGANIIIMKYSSAGVLLWITTYNGSANGDDKAYAIKIDNSHNLYVCGFTTGVNSGADYITLKYTTDGALLWAKSYNGTGNSTDYITAIIVGSDNNLVVTGNSMGTSQPGSEDMVTIKYNASNGNEIWTQRFNGSEINNTTDKVYAITVDKSNNVYLAGNTTGTNLLAIIIISYSSDGELNWQDVWTNPNTSNMDFPTNILCTDNNYVLVSGTSTNGSQTGEDIVTLAIHSNNGNIKWANTFNGTANGTDVACAMSLSESENEVYVSGYSAHNSQNNVLDIITLKYKLANGVLLDSTRFNNTGISKESPVGMAVDSNGNLFITGWTVPINTSKRAISIWEDADIITLKYAIAINDSPNTSEVNKNIKSNNSLYQNFPNPFNPITVIRFNLANSSQVELKIYDILGKEVQNLVSGYLEAGEHNFQFNGGNLSSGIYFYELNVNGVKDIKKMMLIK